MTAASELSFFASADGDLAYRDVGSGDPVVLLHSGFADHRVFDDQIPALAARFRVIAPDIRGHGFSANASAPFRWADDLTGLLRHLDLGPAVLVGLSMGAGVATDTALESPELVRAIVVSGGGTSAFEYKDPELLAHTARAADSSPPATSRAGSTSSRRAWPARTAHRPTSTPRCCGGCAP